MELKTDVKTGAPSWSDGKVSEAAMRREKFLDERSVVDEPSAPNNKQGKIFSVETYINSTNAYYQC